MASRKYLVGVDKREQQQQNSLGVCHGKLVDFFSGCFETTTFTEK